MDEGLFMDDKGSQQRINKMAKVNLNLVNITDAGLVADALKYKGALTGNAGFPTTTPTLAAYGLLMADARAKSAADILAVAAAKTATEVKNASVDALHAGTVQLGGS